MAIYFSYSCAESSHVFIKSNILLRISVFPIGGYWEGGLYGAGENYWVYINDKTKKNL